MDDSQDVVFLSVGSSVGPAMAPWPLLLLFPGLTLGFLQQLQLQPSSTDTTPNEELHCQQKRVLRQRGILEEVCEGKERERL